MAEYVTSDWHFGHSNLCNLLDTRKEYIGNIESMNETIIKNINKVVNNNDTLYCLGDISMFANKDKVLKLVSRINGRIVFVLGNHDTQNTFNYLEKNNYLLPNGLYKFVIEPLGVIIRKNKKTYYLTHYAYDLGEYRKNIRSIHGHIHTNPSLKANALNISIDSPEIPQDIPFGQPILVDTAIELVEAKWENWSLAQKMRKNSEET